MENLMDAGAERAVLAGLLEYGMEAYLDIDGLVDAGSFQHQNNGVIFKCIEKLLKDGSEVDLPSILMAAGQLNVQELIQSKPELEYINLLMRYTVNKGNVVRFAGQMKKYEFARKIRRLGHHLVDQIDNITGDESIMDIIAMVENPVNDLVREDSSTKTPKLIGEHIHEYVDYLIENRCDQIGIATGYPAYDAAIGGGLRRKCVDVVSARPKIGKSVCTSNVAMHIAKQGIPVLLLDTEMSEEDQNNRNMANLGTVSITDVATGKFSDDEKTLKDIMAAADTLHELPLHYVSVAGESMESILNIIKRWVIREVGVDEDGKTNDCVVMYDYLKLMGGLDADIQEYLRLGQQITDLHNLAVKYDFACMAFTQLNRDGITQESTAVVSGSDRIIWLCTSFTIFKEKSPEEIVEDGGIEYGNRKMVPIVSRHGPGMENGNYINMFMAGEYARLTELRTRDEQRRMVATNGALEGADQPFEEDDE